MNGRYTISGVITLAGRVAQPVGGENGLRSDVEAEEQRHEDRGEDRPLRQRPGMIRSRIRITKMNPISSQSAPMSALSRKSAIFTAATVGMLLKLK